MICANKEYNLNFPHAQWYTLLLVGICPRWANPQGKSPPGLSSCSGTFPQQSCRSFLTHCSVWLAAPIVRLPRRSPDQGWHRSCAMSEA
jgi:hypothetical protein